MEVRVREQFPNEGATELTSNMSSSLVECLIDQSKEDSQPLTEGSVHLPSSPSGSLRSNFSAPLQTVNDAELHENGIFVNNQFLGEIWQLADSTSPVGDNELLSLEPWNPSEGQEYSIVSCGISSNFTSSNWSEPPPAVDQWILPSEPGNLTDGLAQTLQESLDLLLTSPFFNSFANSVDDIADAQISPVQDTVCLDGICPENFPLIDTSAAVYPSEDVSRLTSNANVENSRGIGIGRESVVVYGATPDIDRPDKTLVKTSGHLPNSALTDASPDLSVGSVSKRPHPIQNVPAILNAKGAKKRGLTAWELFHKRKADAEKGILKEWKLKKRGSGEKLSRKSYSIQHKIKMVETYCREAIEDEITVTDFCQRNNVDPKGLKAWVMCYDSLKDVGSTNSLKKRIRSRYARFPTLEPVILDWIKNQRSSGTPPKQKDVMTFAKNLSLQLDVAGFRASLGWLKGFSARNGLSFERGNLCTVDGVTAMADVQNHDIPVANGLACAKLDQFIL